jgi:hypothetical protein
MEVMKIEINSAGGRGLEDPELARPEHNRSCFRCPAEQVNRDQGRSDCRRTSVIDGGDRVLGLAHIEQAGPRVSPSFH